MKIFHIVNAVGNGGSEVLAVSIAENTQDGNRHIILEVSKNTSDYARKTRENLSVEVRTLSPFKTKIKLLVAPIVLFLYLLGVKDFKVHSHTDIPDFVVAVVLKLRRALRLREIDVIRTIHNTVLWPTLPRVANFTESCFNDDHIICVSHSACKAYKDLRKRNSLRISSNIDVIYNGLTVSLKEVFKDLDKSKINIAFCGRLEYQKGIDVLLEYLNITSGAFNELVDFHLFGEGKYVDACVDVASRCENVFYHGTIYPFTNFVHNFDFLVIPSRFEGFGLVSVEASMSRVLPIISNNETLKETLPESWPLVFNLDSIEEFKDVLNGLIRNSWDFNELRSLAQKYANENFSIEVMCQKYASVYNN